MKNFIRKSAEVLLGLVPFRLGRELFRAWLVSLDHKPSRETLTEYFGLSDDLTGRINSTAIRHEGGSHPKHRLTAYHDFFTARIGPGDRVLDVGCGGGELAWDLARTGAEVVGADFSGQALERARKREHERLSFVRADVTAQLPPGRFDVIVMSNVLEHIEERVGLLKKLQETGAQRFSDPRSGL